MSSRGMNFYFGGLAICGMLAGNMAVNSGVKAYDDRKAKVVVRDSFDLSKVQFESLKQRVDTNTITWKQALDSLKLDKKYKDGIAAGKAFVLDSLKKARK